MDILPPQSLMILLGLILLWGFLTAFAKEASVVINDKKLEQLAEENQKAARLHQYLEKDSTGFIGAMELISYAQVCFFSVLLVLGFAERTVDKFTGWGLSLFGAYGLTSLFFTVVIVFFYWYSGNNCQSGLRQNLARKLRFLLPIIAFLSQ